MRQAREPGVVIRPAREARGRSAEPYVAPQNRLDPHTSAFAADRTSYANTPPTVLLRTYGPALR